jgi:hypothetical protein
MGKEIDEENFGGAFLLNYFRFAPCCLSMSVKLTARLTQGFPTPITEWEN